MVQQMGFIPYYKMGCKGGNHIPNDAIFARFCETVKHVISSRPKWNEGDFIGVHCCKGVNRTGFMICKYLITRKNITPSKVIEMLSRKVCRTSFDSKSIHGQSRKFSTNQND